MAKKERGILVFDGRIICVYCRLEKTSLKPDDTDLSFFTVSEDETLDHVHEQTTCDSCGREVYAPKQLVKEKNMKEYLRKAFTDFPSASFYILDAVKEFVGEELNSIVTPHRIYVLLHDDIVASVHYLVSKNSSGELEGKYVLQFFNDNEFEIRRKEGRNFLYAVYNKNIEGSENKIYVDDHRFDLVHDYIEERLMQRDANYGEGRVQQDQATIYEASEGTAELRSESQDNGTTQRNDADVEEKSH